MLKVAILGAGAISNSHIEGYLQFSDRCEIVALVNRTEEKAKAKAESFGLSVKIYPSIDDLLVNESVDIVSNCLPPFVHAETTVALLEAGIHVLLEKPMATALDDCDRILEAQRRSGKLLSIIAQNRFQTPMMRMKTILEKGLIGKLLHGQVYSYWWRGHHYYDLWWRGTWEKEGGGCILNQAVHHIDLFNWMMGMPQSIEARTLNINHTNSEVEDFATVLLHYADGKVGQIQASLIHHGEEQRISFQGSEAGVSAPWSVKSNGARENGFPFENLELIKSIEEYYQSLPELEYEGHTGQIKNLLDAIDGIDTVLIDGLQGRQTVELAMAIYESSAKNKVVEIPLQAYSDYYRKQSVIKNANRFHEKTINIQGFKDNTITLGRKL